MPTEAETLLKISTILEKLNKDIVELKISKNKKKKISKRKKVKRSKKKNSKRKK